MTGGSAMLELESEFWFRIASWQRTSNGPGSLHLGEKTFGFGKGKIFTGSVEHLHRKQTVVNLGICCLGTVFAMGLFLLGLQFWLQAVSR